MKLKEIFKRERPVLSLEVFPPKQDTPLDGVFKAISGLKELEPSFISVTYGAGGSQKGRTVEIASTLKNHYDVEPMAHLTCVGQKTNAVDEVLEDLEKSGIENILALSGDPPRDQPDFDRSKDDFKYASELISYIKRKRDFSIAAAAYPEGHKDCPRILSDWEHLKHKVDQGVDLLVTQLFFDNRIFFHFLEIVRGMGVNCPIVPGIMPVYNAKQIKRIVSLCGASMPPEMLIMVDKYADSPEDMKKAGIEYAINQIQGLLDHGVDGVHVMPLNQASLAKEIVSGLSWPDHK
ncbi:MAG: methylenetetrahydrofolate reductase [NAD(P)H] [Verrucomicrobia bacterium]|nr:methylenetetrahydrofolate reductase [NAD(P)H] [Verrucomicrobiota bacterium]